MSQTVNAEQTAKKLTRKEKKQAKKEEPKSLKKEILSWVWTLLAAVVIASVIRGLLFEPIRIDGESMLDTLNDGEIVFVTKPEYIFGQPQRGDVIICRYPNRYNNFGQDTDGDGVGNGTFRVTLGGNLDFSLTSYTLFSKRLIALPGDTIEIKLNPDDGKYHVYINDELSQEDYITASRLQWRPYEKRTLGENEYFVMGDNRATSRDSRASEVGPITRDMIIGHVRCVLWPLNKIRGIE